MRSEKAMSVVDSRKWAKGLAKAAEMVCQLAKSIKWKKENLLVASLSVHITSHHISPIITIKHRQTAQTKLKVSTAAAH